MGVNFNMDPSTATEISSLCKASQTWSSVVKVKGKGGKDVTITSMEKDVLLDHDTYSGEEDIEKLKQDLQEECGCKMAMPSQPCTGTRFKRWHCRCSCCYLQKVQDESKFDEGCNSLKGCKEESVKRQNKKSSAAEGKSKKSDAVTKGKEVAGELGL